MRQPTAPRVHSGFKPVQQPSLRPVSGLKSQQIARINQPATEVLQPVNQRTPISARNLSGNGHVAQRRELPPTVALPLPGQSVPTVQMASVTSIAPWIAEQNKRRRHGKLRKASTAVGLTLGLGGLTWLAGFSTFLALDAEQIQVIAEPDSLVDLGAVTDLAQRQAGTPLIRVRTANLTEQLQELPAVKDVAVTRAWPNGLNVNISSRVPAAAVTSPNGFTWIDEIGVAIGQFADPGELAKLEGPLDQARLLADLVTVWQSLPAQLQEAARVTAGATTDTITTTLHSGQVIKWGSAEQLKLKIATVEALLARAPKSAVFDVSSPALPVTR